MRPFLVALTGVVTGVFGLMGLFVPLSVASLHYPFGLHFVGFAFWLIFGLSILAMLGCSSMHSTSWQVKHYMGLAPQHGSLWNAISAIASFLFGIAYWFGPTVGFHSTAVDRLLSAWLLALGLGIVVLISISRDAVREEREAREAEQRHAFA